MPDKEWCSTVVQLAISTAGKSSTPHSIYLLLLSGIERLVVTGKLVVGRVLEQVCFNAAPSRRIVSDLFMTAFKLIL